MSWRYVWPTCTFRGCDHKRTWGTEKRATTAYMAHPTWSQGDEATCICHTPDGFPCDTSLRAGDA